MSVRLKPSTSNVTTKRKSCLLEEMEYSDNGDSSDLESDNGEVLDEESDESDDLDVSLATESFRKVSKNYNDTQKKLELEHNYDWRLGEKVYDTNLSNECLLSDRDKAKILQMPPLQLFESFLSQDLKNYIIKATCENGFDLNLDNLDAFIGIVIFSSINKRSAQKDYWSNDPLLGSEPVKNAMSRNTFYCIKSNLKYCLQCDKKENDKVWKLRPILDILKKNILRYGFFSTALSVDEMMVKFYGRLAVKQFIPIKPIRYGIKLWAICGSNGYLFSFDVYCGKNAEKKLELSQIAQGSRVVLQMLHDLLINQSMRTLNKYHIYFDNLFCNPDLLIHLKKLGVRATGVVRKDRITEKNELDKKAAKGTHIAKFDKNSELNYVTARDSNDVSILSTAACVTPLTVMKRYVKENHEKSDVLFPNVFSKYKQFIGGVDIHDQHCNNILPSIRSKKWTWVLFLRIIQTSITNATILYNTVREIKRKVGTKEIALEVCRDYLTRTAKPIVKEHSLDRLKNSLKCSTAKCVIKTNIFAKPVKPAFVLHVYRKTKIAL